MLTPESPNSIRSGVRPYFMPRDCLRLHIQSRFRCHDNVPNIDFSRFFAHPFQITATGPQTISEIMETHAHICDRAASQLESIQSGDIESPPVEWRHWERYHLLPLCRAVVVVLDELLLSPPVCRIDGTISLDDEIQRRTAVLILTGYGHGLSNTISFDAIKSEFLPLARDDVCACDSARTIRVSLKTAVQFIAELQQREDTAFSSLKQDTVNTILEPNTYGVFAVDRADEYVDDVLNNPLEDESKQSEIKYARETIKMRERGEVSYEAEFDHWNSSWI
jgi:hypothetical protein